MGNLALFPRQPGSLRQLSEGEEKSHARQIKGREDQENPTCGLIRGMGPAHRHTEAQLNRSIFHYFVCSAASLLLKAAASHTTIVPHKHPSSTEILWQDSSVYSSEAIYRSYIVYHTPPV